MTQPKQAAVGTLTAADLGRQFRVEWGGWIHTGALAFANHEVSPGSGELRTFIGLTAASGSRWMQHLPSEWPIEAHSEGPRCPHKCGCTSDDACPHECPCEETPDEGDPR